MESTLKKSACRALAAGLIAGSAAVPVALASSPMPVAQQNALVQKYCAVCHTDAQAERRALAPAFRRGASRSRRSGHDGQQTESQGDGSGGHTAAGQDDARRTSKRAVGEGRRRGRVDCEPDPKPNDAGTDTDGKRLAGGAFGEERRRARHVPVDAHMPRRYSRSRDATGMGAWGRPSDGREQCLLQWTEKCRLLIRSIKVRGLPSSTQQSRTSG